VLGHRLRRPREAPVRLEVDRGHATAESLEERGHDHRARAAHAVERDAEPPPPNPLDVEEGDREHAVEVPLDGALVRLDRPEAVPARARHPGLHEAPHRRPLVRLEKEPARADELEGVPLDRVVARRDHEPPRGAQLLDRQLRRRRGRQPEVDDPAADRLERGEHRAVEHRPRHPAVSPDDDRGGGGARARPRAERRREVRDDLRREPLAHAPADPGHADH
jgi:hypothetical protein